MILRNVYIRFFRAFNFDYIRAHDSRATADPWDEFDDGAFYPYIKLGIDKEITTVVGANESGKSHLLDAIEYALGVREVGPADFCRYSQYFTVTDAMPTPHVGLEFVDLTQAESDQVRAIAGSEGSELITSLRVFRTNPDGAEIYLEPDSTSHRITDESVGQLNAILPSVYRIHPELAIPDSVPLDYLIGRTGDDYVHDGPTRRERLELFDAIVPQMQNLRAIRGNESAFANEMRSVFQGLSASGDSIINASDRYHRELGIAFNLLVTISGIEPSAFVHLHAALRSKKEGLAIGIVDLINREIETRLDLARWWTQDARFRLAIEARDFDAVFTIRDRTDSAYSFAERSSGMRYFLSYLVQFLTYVESRSGAEILLMDEPDAFLSNQGQQDLLQLLQEFALPTPESQGQVVYVTHSPFLIDKNRADRIRLLEKGSESEGTRVVPNAVHNHYEPIRTALGGLIGDSAFIGSCNLILEGSSDQHYLAGMSALLRRERPHNANEFLDLNQITLVPSGGATEVPYKTYSAIGRGINKPAVIVLLDGDEAGDTARKALKRFGSTRTPLLPAEHVVQLKRSNIPSLTSDRPGEAWEIEDLLPVEIAVDAAQRYVQEVAHEFSGQFPTPDQIRALLARGDSVLGAVQSAVNSEGANIEFGTRSFARHAVASCEGNTDAPGKLMRDRFAALFVFLTAKQRAVEKERERESLKTRLVREVTRFRRDHQRTPPLKSHAIRFFDDVIRPLVIETEVGEAISEEVRRIESEFELREGTTEVISNPDSLFSALDRLKYAGQNSNGADQ